MSNAQPISFTNADGLMLHGILHLPDARVHTPLGVILLSPGQKCRLGPWRSYVQLARHIAALGVPVLRFDFHGLGDSEGSHEHAQSLVDFNGFVQTGGLARDVISAAEFFTNETGVTRFVFAGLCGGASTGLIAARHIPGLYGHVLIDLPVTVSSSARQRYLEQNAAELLRLRPEESHGVLRGYLARIRDPGAWRRLLSGSSDYGLLWESVKRVLMRKAESVFGRLPGPLRLDADARVNEPPAAIGTPAKGADEQVNATVIEAFEAARAQGQKMFFLNSSAYHPMFERYFGSEYLGAGTNLRGIGLLAVPETNHVLSAEHGQRALFECVEEFVRNAIAELADRPSVLRGSAIASNPRAER